MRKPITKEDLTHFEKIQLQLQLTLSGWTQGTYNDAHVLLCIDDWELLQDAERGPSVALIVQEDLDEGHHAMIFQDNWEQNRQDKGRPWHCNSIMGKASSFNFPSPLHSILSLSL